MTIALMMINDVIKLLLKSLHDELLTEMKIEKRKIFLKKKKVFPKFIYNLRDITYR